MKAELTKGMKKKLRALAGTAHERELRKALSELDKRFAAWRSSALDSLALSDAIHEFHEGPAREIYLRYSGNHLEDGVAWAIHRGVLSEAEAGPEVLATLQGWMGFFRAQDARSRGTDE